MITNLQPSCLFRFCSDAEVAADDCFYLHGNCRRTLFNQRCLSRCVSSSVIGHIKRRTVGFWTHCVMGVVTAIKPVGSFSALEAGSFQ